MRLIREGGGDTSQVQPLKEEGGEGRGGGGGGGGGGGRGDREREKVADSISRTEAETAQEKQR